MFSLSLLPEEILYIEHISKKILFRRKVELKLVSVFEKIKEADYYFKDFKDILELIKMRNLFKTETIWWRVKSAVAMRYYGIRQENEDCGVT